MLRSEENSDIPDLTKLVAQAAFLEGSVVMTMRDELGPVPSSKSWQDRTESAFDHSQFDIDWNQLVATCPVGKTSAFCLERKTWRGTPNLSFVFHAEDCFPCSLYSRCSRAKGSGRTLTIYPHDEYETLLESRQRQETEEFKKRYGERSGIEGTISQGVRKMG